LTIAETLDMKDYLPLFTILSAGLFGLAVAVVTSLLTGRKETGSYRRDAKWAAYSEVKETYRDTLGYIGLAARLAMDRTEVSSIYKELSLADAKLELLGNKDVRAKGDEVSKLLYSWDAEHRQIGIAGPNHLKSAEELYSRFISANETLAALMRSHLEELRKQAE
jgi:hypothetical protein